MEPPTSLKLRYRILRKLINSPCLQQGCMTCCTPINHVLDLNAALDGPNTPTLPTSSTWPQPPPNHLILTLTSGLQDAILKNDIFELTTAKNQYTLALNSDPDFMLYVCSNLRAAHKLAVQILTSIATASTPLPASPTNSLLHTQPPSASFKSPKLVTNNWSGQSYDFYPWLSSVLNEFTLTRCNNVNQVFDLLPCFESVQEVAKHLAPKIKTLQANLEIVKQFNDVDDLHSIALTQPLSRTS